MALNCKLILIWYLIKSDEWLDSNSYAGRKLWIWTLFQLTMFSMDGYMKNFFSRNFSLGNVSAQGYPAQMFYDLTAHSPFLLKYFMFCLRTDLKIWRLTLTLYWRSFPIWFWQLVKLCAWFLNKQQFDEKASFSCLWPISFMFAWFHKRHFVVWLTWSGKRLSLFWLKLMQPSKMW